MDRAVLRFMKSEALHRADFTIRESPRPARRPPTLLPPPFRRPAQGVGKRAFAFALRLTEEALLAARDALARLRPRFRRVVEPHGQRDALARHVDLQHL